MAIVTDQELISTLLQATNDRRILWEKTDVTDQFAAKYAGKWTLMINKSENFDDPYTYWLGLSNAEGEEILRINSSQETRLDDLFELARRRALKVDEALKDLLNQISPEVKDEDLPF